MGSNNITRQCLYLKC